jgi:hypothetical protein
MDRDGAVAALSAAVLFGLSAPFAKLLVADMGTSMEEVAVRRR